LPENILERLGALAALLTDEPQVVFAYIFGGLLRERNHPPQSPPRRGLRGGIDIAVYVKDVRKLDYLRLYGRITEAVGTDEVDLVILNDAPISLAGRILQNRKVLVDKEPFFRHKYESLALRQFHDFRLKEKDILRRRYGIG